jgi:hypothetical protein
VTARGCRGHRGPIGRGMGALPPPNASWSLPGPFPWPPESSVARLLPLLLRLLFPAPAFSVFYLGRSTGHHSHQECFCFCCCGRGLGALAPRNNWAVRPSARVRRTCSA